MATINWKSGHSVGKSTCAVDWQIPTWFAWRALYKYLCTLRMVVARRVDFQKSIYFPVNVFVLGAQLAGRKERRAGGQQPAAFKHGIILRLFYRATIFSSHTHNAGNENDHFIYTIVPFARHPPFSVSMQLFRFKFSYHVREIRYVENVQHSAWLNPYKQSNGPES